MNKAGRKILRMLHDNAASLAPSIHDSNAAIKEAMPTANADDLMTASWIAGATTIATAISAFDSIPDDDEEDTE